ncbi:hypothetical protein [Spirillospora sp. CA-294931]|uniref:hypothetical protein n=1 Tax=Spirillospora sp. CA-294931 TaxID=3240042 RepID=UPI003D93AAC9
MFALGSSGGSPALSGVIDPSAIPIPKANPDDVEAAGNALKKDGTGISQTGHDINSGWQGLSEFYVAPESGLLLNAPKPVAAAGDAFKGEVTTVGDALITFAGEVRPIISKIQGLKSSAQTFRNKIDGDDDWRKDEDKVNEHNKLNNDVLAALAQYQEAERSCANKITGIFGGTRFVPGDGKPGAGEKGYGMGKAPKDVETPWAKPQEHDKPWYEDAWNGVTDFVGGILTDLGDLTGLHGKDGWLWDGGNWLDNMKNNYTQVLQDLGGLVGLHGKDGWVWDGGSWWGNFSGAWTEVAHSFVPWREWGDRPGYVITQSILNIGSLAIGVGEVKLISKLLKRGDADAPNTRDGDSDGDGRLDDNADLPSNNSDPNLTTRELQNELGELDINDKELSELQNSLDDAGDFKDREPASVPDREQNGDTDPPKDDQPGNGTDPGKDDQPGNDSDPGQENDPGQNNEPGHENDPGKEDQQQPPKGDGGDGPKDPPGDKDPKGNDGGDDPEREKALKKADALEDSLRKGGLSDEQIERLRGDNPRDGDQWQRLASALEQNFGKKTLKAAPDIHSDALRFAMEGADNPRAVAYRYEYFKARYDEAMRAVEADVKSGDLPAGTNKAKAAVERFNEIDVRGDLERDVADVRAARPGGGGIDPGLKGDARTDAVRGQAGDIGMGNDTSSAYHARKHYKELPDSEKHGDIVNDYLNSAERTIREGELRSRNVDEDGTERLEFVREVDGAKLRAVVIVRPDGKIVMPTYGQVK